MLLVVGAIDDDETANGDQEACEVGSQRTQQLIFNLTPQISNTQIRFPPRRCNVPHPFFGTGPAISGAFHGDLHQGTMHRELPLPVSQSRKEAIDLAWLSTTTPWSMRRALDSACTGLFDTLTADRRRGVRPRCLSSRPTLSCSSSPVLCSPSSATPTPSVLPLYRAWIRSPYITGPRTVVARLWPRGRGREGLNYDHEWFHLIAHSLHPKTK